MSPRSKTSTQKPKESVTWAESFFLAFYRMVKVVKIHKDNNRLVIRFLKDFKQVVSKIDIDDDLTILISDEHFYIRGERLQYRNQLTEVIDTLLHFFQRLRLQGLRFNASVTNAPQTEILAFFRLLIYLAEKKDAASLLSQRFRDIRIDWVHLVQKTGTKTDDLDPDIRERGISLYFDVTASVKEISKKISLQGYAGIRKSRRMIQGMIDCVVKDESIFLGLSTIRDYDDYTYTHSVNVAVLSLCLGKRVGLSHRSLEYLGICGLFHDLGKIDIPREIVKKPGDLDREEWQVIRKHPLTSVKQILKLHAPYDLKSKILVAPFEHHINNDMTGYPKLRFKKGISLFGKILHITDVYDAVTSPRVYRKDALSPDRAISFLLKGMGTDFDPVLLKVFIMMMGTYPIGTLLELDTGEMGFVIDYPNDSGCPLPRLALLEKDENGVLRRGDLLDLNKKDLERNHSRRRIKRSMNPAFHGIQPAHFIVSKE